MTFYVYFPAFFHTSYQQSDNKIQQTKSVDQSKAKKFLNKIYIIQLTKFYSQFTNKPFFVFLHFFPQYTGKVKSSIHIISKFKILNYFKSQEVCLIL